MATKFTVDVDAITQAFAVEVEAAEAQRDTTKSAKDIAFALKVVKAKTESEDNKGFVQQYTGKLTPVLKVIDFFQNLIQEYDRTNGETLATQIRLLGSMGGLDLTNETIADLLDRWEETSGRRARNNTEAGTDTTAKPYDFDFALRVVDADGVVISKEGARNGWTYWSNLVSKVQTYLRDEGIIPADGKLSPEVRKAFREAKDYFSKADSFNSVQAGDFIVERWDTKRDRPIHSLEAHLAWKPEAEAEDLEDEEEAEE